MNRKIISMLLTLVLFLTLLPTAAFAAGETPYTAGAPAGGTYTISTAEQLKALADAVNSGEPYKNTTFTLTQDIDLSSVCSKASGISWLPIGTYNAWSIPGIKPFSGSFDGGGHTISGLYIDRKDYDQALFGLLKGGAIKNLCVDGEVTGEGNVSGIAGRSFGTVENCVSTCELNGYEHVGGLVGINDGTLRNCTNRGPVNGSVISGGLVGMNYGTMTDCQNTGDVIGKGDLGGIVGGNPGTVTNSSNMGKVSGEEYIGGVVGNNAGTMKNCRNVGTVSGTLYVGGFAGENRGTVKNSYNTGTVDGNLLIGGCFGGFVGINHGLAADCYNTAPVHGSGRVGGVAGLNEFDGVLERCYSVGQATAPESEYAPLDIHVGGVAGISSSNVKNCYYLLDMAAKGIDEDTGSGMAIGLTETAFAKAGSFAGWDFSNTWGMSTDADDPRPVLRSIPEHDYQSGSAPVESSFTDVSPAAYYAVPVAWAVKQEITAGTGGGKFSPNDPCTRAQAMTFLWKAMGSPAVSTENNFSDVSESAYYFDAVNWAVANGVTSGTGDGKFSPDQKCTRAQIVTFLWKAAGSQRIGNGVFSDVPADAYYNSAVSWAVANGITSGTGDGKFSPDDHCTRGQIVTLLWHDMGE